MAKDGKCLPQAKRCYRGGKEGHIGCDEACPARNAKCKKYQNVEQYDGVRRTSRRSRGGQKKNPSKVNSVEDDDEDEYAFTVGLGTGTSDEALIDVRVEGITVKNMLIDSGATCNLIKKATWSDLKEQSCKQADPLKQETVLLWII